MKNFLEGLASNFKAEHKRTKKTFTNLGKAIKKSPNTFAKRTKKSFTNLGKAIKKSPKALAKRTKIIIMGSVRNSQKYYRETGHDIYSKHGYGNKDKPTDDSKT